MLIVRKSTFECLAVERDGTERVRLAYYAMLRLRQ